MFARKLYMEMNLKILLSKGLLRMKAIALSVIGLFLKA